MIARTPEPPYVAVIFTSQRRNGDEAYGRIADRMVALAEARDGYLGHESLRDAEGFGITVSYWRDEAAALAWRADTEHQEAQRLGRAAFYSAYSLRVATVTRQVHFEGGP